MKIKYYRASLRNHEIYICISVHMIMKLRRKLVDVKLKYIVFQFLYISIILLIHEADHSPGR